MYFSDLTCFCITYLLKVCFCMFILLDSASSEIDEYYWRDYKGVIPEDALSGGQENGETTYIAQVLHKEQLIPAKLFPSQTNAYYEWGGREHVARQNIKVLCTTHPEQFEWVKTNSHNFNSITNKNFIECGYEPGMKLYIGRTNYDGEVQIGKLLVNEDVVLHTSKNGEGLIHFLFEALAFNNSLKMPFADLSNRAAISNEQCTIIKLYY